MLSQPNHSPVCQKIYFDNKNDLISNKGETDKKKINRMKWDICKTSTYLLYDFLCYTKTKQKFSCSESFLRSQFKLRDKPPSYFLRLPRQPPKKCEISTDWGPTQRERKKRKNKSYEIKKRKIAIFLAATWICFLILAVGGLRGLEMTGRGSDKET